MDAKKVAKWMLRDFSEIEKEQIKREAEKGMKPPIEFFIARKIKGDIKANKYKANDYNPNS